TLALAGSANLDSRSLFLNYELMFAFHGAPAVAHFADWFERERALAHRHAPEHASLCADVIEGLVLWLGFQL
ncbi:MAG: phospholipase D-like domain-containing protein, partial [Burkholderiaceae bacterium]